MQKSLPHFDPSDVDDGPMPEELGDLMLDLMLSWPLLEMGFTQWIAFARGVPISEAAAEIGTKSNVAKLKELKDLYASKADPQAAALLSVVVKEYEEFARVRNRVAHGKYLGTSKSKANTAYFLTTRAVPKQQGFMEVAAMAFSNFKEARAFAIQRSRSILDLLAARGVKFD
jgi:hypothetical protein